MPTPFRPRLLALALAVASLLAGCETTPPHTTFPDIRFTAEPPIGLEVAAIDIRNDYQPSFRAPHVEHLFPVPPARAAENWAHDRLKAVGNAGRARFTIKDAEVIEVELKKASEGIRGALTTEPAERYDMTLEASLDALDAHGLPLRTVTVKATRSQTVLEGATPNQREETWYAMTKSIMADFDRQMETEIRNNFGPYLQ
jgi:hypothetical protein